MIYIIGALVPNPNGLRGFSCIVSRGGELYRRESPLSNHEFFYRWEHYHFVGFLDWLAGSRRPGIQTGVPALLDVG